MVSLIFRIFALQTIKLKQIMARPDVFGFTVTYEDRLELCLKAVKTYVHFRTLEDENNALSPRPLEFLSYYVLEGYSDETKNFMKKALGITSKNVNTVNTKLSNKGYLVNDRFNFTKKHLSPELKELKNYIDTGKDVSKFMLLKFKRNVD